jgi:addiction module HigA family antidote
VQAKSKLSIITKEKIAVSVAPKKSRRAPVSPGEFLIEEFLKPMGMTQVTFAEAIGISKAYLSDIVNGRRGISADMAMRFEAALGMEASFWLRAQAELDLYQAQHDEKTLASSKSIKRLLAA